MAQNTLTADEQKGHGSVYLIQKRRWSFPATPPPCLSNIISVPQVCHDPSSTSTPTAPLSDLEPQPTPLPILIRATDGKSQSKQRKKNSQKVKLSTVVAPEELEAFFTRYADVCKTGMQSLKKRDRSKRKKDRGKKKKTTQTAEKRVQLRGRGPNAPYRAACEDVLRSCNGTLCPRKDDTERYFSMDRKQCR
nr:hypothetical protein CFP56_71900 [Quercus suber]